MKNFIILITLLFLFGCTKIVTEVNLPKVEPQLVLYSFLSPEDSEIQAFVGMSNPVFNNQNLEPIIVQNAIVTINDENNNADTLVFNIEKFLYTLNQTKYTIKEGKTYKLTVYYDNKVVFAETKIPDNLINIKSIEVVKTGNSSSSDLPYAKLYVNWNDKTGEVNYYRVFNKFSNTNSQYGISDNFYTDINAGDGATFTSNSDIYGNWSGSANIEVDTYLLNTDIHYYQYHSRRVGYIGDGPFSEPFQQYSNVNGGLGCVGSFRKHLVATQID